MASCFPHITISITRSSRNSQGTDATGDLNSLSIGFGLFQAWIYMAVFGTTSVFSRGELLPHFAYLPQELAPLVFNSFMGSFAVCLLFIAFSNQALLKFYVAKSALTLAATLASVGTYLIYATCLGGAGPVFAALSGCAMGLGASLMVALWGTAFARYEFATIILNAVAAVVLGVAAYLVLIHWTITPFSGIISGLLPIAASLILWKLTPLPYYRRQEMPIFHPLPIHRVAFTVRFGIPTLIFGFALGALRHISISGILPIDDITSQLIIGAAACAGVGVTLVAVALFRDEAHWDMTFRFVVPIVAAAVFCIPLMFTQYSLPASFFIVAGYVCFEVLMWFLFADLAQEFRLSPIFVFGLGRGLLEVGTIVGSQFSQLPPGDPVASLFLSPLGASVLLLALFVASALLPRQREIRAIVDPNHGFQEPAFSKLQEQVNGETFQDDGEDEDAPIKGVAEVDEKSRAKGRFHARCEQIADQYLLSRRETEVMFLLAKGHNAAFVQEKLCISKSTAKTHINHIYRKLDIHTQQELLNMVEERSSTSGSWDAGEEGRGRPETFDPYKRKDPPAKTSQ